MQTATAPQPTCTQAQARQLLDDLKAAFLILPEEKRAILVTELRSTANLDGTNDRPSAAERQHSFASHVTLGKESGTAGWHFHPEFTAPACEASI
jgi:hypothetical protein